MLKLIERLDKKTKKKIAFVLYDGGCTNQFGLKMLENYSDTIRKKPVIFLDSLGNGDTLQFFKPHHFDYQQEDITFHDGKMNTTFKKYLMITAGELDDNQQVVIKNGYSSKDNTVSDTVIEKHADSLYNLLIKMIKL